MRVSIKAVMLAGMLVLALMSGAWSALAQDGGQSVSVQPYDLRAGIANSAALLSADGAHLAVVSTRDVCIYGADGQVERCRELARELRGVNIEDARWSPDGRYLALALDFFRLLIDSDIWLFDTTTGGLLNLTWDNVDKFDLSGKTDSQSDILPRWSSDGTRLLFMRYTQKDGVRLAPALCMVTLEPASFGLPECSGPLVNDEEAPWAFVAMDWDDVHGRVALAYSAGESDEGNGVWIANDDGTGARQVLALHPRDFPLVSLSFAPDGESLLVFGMPGMLPPTPDLSPLRLVRLDAPSLELIDPEHYVYSAAWAPDGSRLAYLLVDRTAPDRMGLYLTDAPGQAGELVLPGSYLPTTPRHSQFLTWIAQGKILVTRPEDGYPLAVVQLTVG